LCYGNELWIPYKADNFSTNEILTAYREEVFSVQ